MSLSSTTDDKISERSKLKAFADEELKVAQMTKLVLDRRETLWEKEKKCWFPAFSRFFSVFSFVCFGVLRRINSISVI